MRITLLTVVFLWVWLADRVAAGAGGESFESSVAEGFNATLSCVIERHVACFGPQHNIDYSQKAGPIAWIVSFTLFVAFVRHLEIRNARGELVSIQVDNFSDSSQGSSGPSTEARAVAIDKEKGVHADHGATCTAIMRRTLATYFETPPPIPGAEPTLSLPMILNEASPREGNIATKLLALIWHIAFPTRGWKLAGNIEFHPRTHGSRSRIIEKRRRHPKPSLSCNRSWGVTVQVTERFGSRSVDQSTHWHHEFEEASYEAAYQIAQIALESSPRLPEWVKWKSKSGRGLRLYRDGVEYAREGDYRQATDLLSQAVAIDPGNALASAEYALALEGIGEYAEALEIYLELTRKCPLLFQSQYRAGMVMDLFSAWRDKWQRLDSARRERMRRALVGANLIQTNELLPNGSSQETERFFLECSGRQFESLKREMRYTHLLRKCVSRRETRTIFLPWLQPSPWGSLRRAAIDAIDTAKCGQELHLILNDYRGRDCMESPPPLEELRRHDERIGRLERRLSKTTSSESKADIHHGFVRIFGSNFRVGTVGAFGKSYIAGLSDYNACCFYARLVTPKKLRDVSWVRENETAAGKAVWYLEAAMRRSELREGWIRILESDPDMKWIRGHSAFLNWLPKRLEGNQRGRRKTLARYFANTHSNGPF